MNRHYEKLADGTVKCIEDEVPFEVPQGWMWCRLESLFNMQAGKNITSLDISVLKTSKNIYPCFGGNGIRGFVPNYNNEGTFPIMGRQGALCGNINIAFGKFYATEHAVVIDNFGITDILWAYYFLIGLNLNQYATATAQPGLSVAKILKTYIPLPPLSEQKRIVKQIEKLKPFIEKYDKNEKVLEQFEKTFPELLKKSILQYAIQGKLISQNPNDEPASELLKRIRIEKERLIKEKKIKRDKVDSLIFKGDDNKYYERIGKNTVCIEDKLPFQIPQNWTWVKLYHLGHIIGGGTPKTGKSEYWNNGIFNWITPVDLGKIKEKYISGSNRKITYDGLNNSSAQLMEKGSIIYSSRAPIGYIAITNEKTCTNQGCKSIQPYNNELSDWIYYVLTCFTSDIISRASGTTFKEISGYELGQTIIPLAPIEEQKRIIPKLECLLPKIIV